MGEAPLTPFSSIRERWLWGWTVAVILAIYSTLGIANSLAWVMTDQTLGVVLFVVGMISVLLCVLTQGLKRRPGGTEIGVALGVFAAYLLVFVRMLIPTERSHLIEYGVVAVLLYETLLERRSQGRPVPVPAILSGAIAVTIGIVDECLQGLVPSRVFDVEDIVFNTLAVVMAIAGMSALRWARGRVDRFRAVRGRG